MPNPAYDLAIVGGGMAGATLALALSGHGLRILLIEAAEPKVDAVPNYDDRAIALAEGSVRIFRNLNVWSRMAHEAEAIRDIHVSEQGGFGFAHLRSSEEQVPALGHVIPARALGQGLYAALADCKDVEFLAPAELVAFDQQPDQVKLSIRRQGVMSDFDVRLLVAADGADSPVRAKLGLPVREWRYGQHAVIANLTPSKPHLGLAFERFIPGGAMAMLPLPNNQAALVWTVPDSQVKSVLALEDKVFLDQVQKLFGWRLGRLRQVGKRSSYPLRHLRALNSVSNRVVVIGNAAHALHPIAGQGFNLGIRDVAALAELVVEAQHQHQDVGSSQLLSRYEQWRSRDQQGVGMATDTLVRLFTNPLSTVRIARNLGLLALDALPPAKHVLARAAMGMHGRMPNLIRGVALG